MSSPVPKCVKYAFRRGLLNPNSVLGIQDFFSDSNLHSPTDWGRTLHSLVDDDVPLENGALRGTNISPLKVAGKMILLFPRWDMLVPCRVKHAKQISRGTSRYAMQK